MELELEGGESARDRKGKNVHSFALFVLSFVCLCFCRSLSECFHYGANPTPITHALPPPVSFSLLLVRLLSLALWQHTTHTHGPTQPYSSPLSPSVTGSSKQVVYRQTRDTRVPPHPPPPNPS